MHDLKHEFKTRAEACYDTEITEPTPETIRADTSNLNKERTFKLIALAEDIGLRPTFNSALTTNALRFTEINDA